MNSGDLPHAATLRIAQAIEAHADYLRRLSVRMVDCGFARTDPLWLDVVKASDAMRALELRLQALEQAKRPCPYSVRYDDQDQTST